MSNSVKTKFTGFLRKLLHRQHSGAEKAPVPAAHIPAAPPAMQPDNRRSYTTDPISSPPPAEKSPAPFATTARGDTLALPAGPILAALPAELRAKTVSVPPEGMHIHLPLEVITSQLSRGAVRISFGELRRLIPGIFGQVSDEVDKRMISLPLSEILPRLKPAHLTRRTTTKVQVADEIAGPFENRANGVSFTTQPLKTGSPAATPEQPAPVKLSPAPALTPAPLASTPAMPRPGIPTPAPVLANIPPPVAKAPVSAPVPPAKVHAYPARTATPPAAPQVQTMLPAMEATPPIKFSSAPPPPPVKPTVPGPKLDSPAFRFHTAPNSIAAPEIKPAGTIPTTPVLPNAVAPTAMPSAQPPVPSQATILVPLLGLAELWPTGIKEEIHVTALDGIKIPLPLSLMEAGLKRGRIKMTWGEIHRLARPGSPASPNDGVELELPLKVVAPLFLAAQRNSQATQKKTAVSEEIPNLFFGFPQPAVPPPAPAAAPPIAPSISAQRSPAHTADSNFYTQSDIVPAQTPQDTKIFAPPVTPQTDFTSRQAHPKDVVARAMALQGVAGVVIALPDGLRVSSEVPGGINADTIAAFIPQVFERMNQSTKELRMGALNNIAFTVGNTPWKIFRVNSVFLAAFGRAGENLPAGPLAMLAVELDRKKQP